MIFILTYKIGTNENKKERRALWDSQEEALAQQRVLGGVVKRYEEVNEKEMRKMQNRKEHRFIQGYKKKIWRAF